MEQTIKYIAGWYTDYENNKRLRYYDGKFWTSNTCQSPETIRANMESNSFFSKIFTRMSLSSFLIGSLALGYSFVYFSLRPGDELLNEGQVNLIGIGTCVCALAMSVCITFSSIALIYWKKSFKSDAGISLNVLMLVFAVLSFGGMFSLAILVNLTYGG